MTDAIRELQGRMRPVFERYGFVLKASVFGSYARGEETNDSDVDIVIEYQEGASLLDICSLQRKLGEAVDRKVDVLTYPGMKPKVLASILKEKIDVYERSERPLGRYARTLGDLVKLSRWNVLG